jgi:hypothetical protein
MFAVLGFSELLPRAFVHLLIANLSLRRKASATLREPHELLSVGVRRAQAQRFGLTLEPVRTR